MNEAELNELLHRIESGTTTADDADKVRELWCEYLKASDKYYDGCKGCRYYAVIVCLATVKPDERCIEQGRRFFEPLDDKG